MPDLSRSEAIRLLAGLERRRQTAIDAGNIGEMERAEAQMARIRDGFGVNKFYLGKTGQGALYLLFCWAVIPSLMGPIEGVAYLTHAPEEFALRHS